MGVCGYNVLPSQSYSCAGHCAIGWSVLRGNCLDYVE